MKRPSLWILLAVLFGAVAASPEVLDVPEDYTTIQAAIDAAQAGDTVLISGGPFAEETVIDKDITVKGDPSCKAVLDAQGGSAITILGGVVSISDVAFLRGGESVVIYDPHVIGDGAVSIQGDSFVLIQRCSFTESEMGIAIRDQSSAVLANCEFVGVDLPLLVAEAAHCSVRDCRLMQGKWALLGIMDSNIEITRSHIEDFQYVGLMLSSNAEMLVRETTISPPGKWAVKISGQARMTMRNCSLIRGSAGEMFSMEALQATNHAYVELLDSVIAGRARAVLRLKLAAKALVVRSQLLGEPQDAVFLSDESSIEINGCTIQGAAESGVQLIDESRARITCCQFLGAMCGIALSGAAEANLAKSTFRGNMRSAVEAREQSLVRLFDCEISGAVYGLDVLEEATCLFVGGTVTGCSEAGVWARGHATAELTRALVSENHVGIRASDSAALGVFQTEVCMNDYGVCADCERGVNPVPVAEYGGVILGRGNIIRGNREVDSCPERTDPVWPSGFAASAEINVPRDYESIQAAIDTALPGDVIRIEEGRYEERLVIGKPVSLEAAGLRPVILVAPDWTGVLAVVEPGCGSVRISHLEFRAASTAIEACLQAGDSLHLHGITVLSSGCGIDVQGDGCLIAENAHVADVVGTGMLIEDTTAVIYGCSFLNSQPRAAGAFKGNGIVLIGDISTSISDNSLFGFAVPISIRETRAQGAITEARRPFTGSVSGNGNRGDQDWAALIPVPRNPNAPWPGDFFDVSEGITRFQDALAILREANHPIPEAEALSFLSMAEHSIGLALEATEHYAAALELSVQYRFDLIFTALVEHTGDARIHEYFEGLRQLTDAFKAAWLSFYRGERDAGLQDYATALEEAEEARAALAGIHGDLAGQGWEQELVWQVPPLLGDLYREAGEADKALGACQEAVQAIEFVSVSILAEELRLFWYERTRKAYERLIELLYQMGEGTSAFLYAERCRARSSLDLVAAGPIDTLANVAEEGIRSRVVMASAIWPKSSPAFPRAPPRSSTS